MLPAIGAVSLALDAIQSLTSSATSSSSQPNTSFGTSLIGAADNSVASPATSTAVSGFSGPQISSDNISALLDAGSQTSDSSQSQTSSASASASSAYNAINQLTQSTAIPLAFSPISVSA